MNLIIWRGILLIICMLGIQNVTHAQVSLLSLGENNPVLEKYLAENPQIPRLKNNKVCADLTVSLPFFDDFANNPNGYYPDCSKWQDNHAFVNNTMASNPPSIGVATLDGLNPDAKPYNRQAGVPPVSADTLTSQLFDFSGKTAADKLVLSYFFQAQGLSDRPEQYDSLIVEFKDSAGIWSTQRSYEGVPNTVSTFFIPPFRQDFIEISDGKYFHNNFQFRFRNFATVSGNNDHWHIDYVYLDQNRTDTVAPVYYADVAFTHPPKSPMGLYHAIPWNHFVSGVWMDSLKIGTRNHSNISGTLDRTITVNDLDSSNPSPLLLTTQTPAITYSPSPNSNDSYNNVLLSSFNSFNPVDKTMLETTYVIDNPTDFQNNPIFQHNDTARHYAVLDNYYAYDDGTAEMRIIAQNIGTQVAIEFKTFAADTLRGLYFHLPYFTNRDAELDYINVKVWVDDLNNEVFSRDIYRLRYVGGFNGFHYVELVDFADVPTPIGMAANTTFYIGWQQASTISVPIGFDRNSNLDAKTFVKVGGNAWANPNLGGVPMIRPLFSPSPVYQLLATPERLAEEKISLKLFPNPSKGLLNLESNQAISSDTQIRIHNSLGQNLIQIPFDNSLDLSHLPSGLYLLSLWKEGQQIALERFVKQ